MRAWFGIDPSLCRPPPPSDDPAGEWARRAVDRPLLCLRRPSDDWAAPPGVSFADWIDGALPTRPTYDDLDYHLSTLFPLVRPRGYLEVRYLDAQPGDEWLGPAALLTALFAREATVDTALRLTTGSAGRWLPAARLGLSDPVLAAEAPALLDLACRALPDLDLSPTTISTVTEAAGRRLSRGGAR
jgi:glutamate--cysteine ligase